MPGIVNRILMKKIGQLEINYISHSMYLIQCGFKNAWVEVVAPVFYLVLSILSTISIDDDHNNSKAYTV